MKPSKFALEAARAISAGLDSAEHPISGIQVLEIASRIETAADLRYKRLREAVERVMASNRCPICDYKHICEPGCAGIELRDALKEVQGG